MRWTSTNRPKRKGVMMYEGYFLELEKWIAAAKMSVYFIEFGGAEEAEEAIEALRRANIVIRDLTTELEAIC